MAEYKYISPEVTDGVIRYVDNASIPAEVHNKDWRAYLRYVTEGGLTDPWRTQEQLDEMAAEEAEAAAVEAAKNASGLRNATVDQAMNFIDNKLDAASNAAEVKEALRDILKKMAVFILR